MTSIITANDVLKQLKKLGRKDKANVLQRFFKTGKGQYGEGDVFIGVMVPEQRLLAKKFWQLPLTEVEVLLNNKFHEVRLTALLILVQKYQHAVTIRDKKTIFDFYIKNLTRVNNWDLVDVTTPNIVGDYLLERPRQLLYRLAKSKNLWFRRVSVLACFAFIKNKDFNDFVKLAELHLSDQHDLMHKAVGWMLREMGKRDQLALLKFLDAHACAMPRTMLRYAIEKLDEKVRRGYLGMSRKKI